MLELGSKGAYLVLEDVDIETAVKFSVMGRIYNNCETCVSAKRFIVTDKVYDAFVVAFVTQMKDISMGDLTDENTQLGPLSSQDQFDTAKGQVEGSVAKGAKVLCGGNVPDRKGAYYPATVLGDVAPGMPDYDDEIFDPVAAVIRAKDDGDAMRIANDSRYGLGGGILRPVALTDGGRREDVILGSDVDKTAKRPAPTWPTCWLRPRRRTVSTAGLWIFNRPDWAD